MKSVAKEIETHNERAEAIVKWLDGWGDKIDDGDRPWLINTCQELLRYRVDGSLTTGSFASAVLSNRLDLVVARADERAMRNLRIVVAFAMDLLPRYDRGGVL